MTGHEPGTLFGDLTCVIDDSAGSGNVITFGQADDDRTAWRVTGLTGWDSPDIPETSQPRTGADGSWDSDNFYSGRQVTIDGLIDAPSAAAKDAAKRKLAAAVPARGRLVTFTVNEAVPAQVAARRSGRLMLGDLTDTLVEFSISLLAPDPRKYGVNAVTVSGALGDPAPGLPIPLALPAAIPAQDISGEHFDVVNAGDYATPPMIRIVGPGAGLGVANLTTGATLRYDFPLGLGDELLVDTNAGTALLNGTAYRPPAPGSTVTARFLLPPGTSHMRFLGSRTVTDTSPLVSVQWRDAWI